MITKEGLKHMVLSMTPLMQLAGAQCSTVQYSTVQYSTVQYSTVQYSTVQYSTVQYSTVQLMFRDVMDAVAQSCCIILSDIHDSIS